MPTLRGVPNTTYRSASGRPYRCCADGLIRGVRDEDVPSLLAAGWVATEPWSHLAPRAPSTGLVRKTESSSSSDLDF